MRIVVPPARRFKPHTAALPTLFLAGSIEMGKASDWQSEMISSIGACYEIIYNPRRPDWDSSWEQSIDHPEFNAQVNWELDMIEEADEVVFYFEPDTLAPITLAELGKALEIKPPERLHVCCPPGFWRKGNVDVMCERKGVVVEESLPDLIWRFRGR